MGSLNSAAPGAGKGDHGGSREPWPACRQRDTIKSVCLSVEGRSEQVKGVRAPRPPGCPLGGEGGPSQCWCPGRRTGEPHGGAWRSPPWTGPGPSPYLLRAARASCWKGNSCWVSWPGRCPWAVTPPPPKRCHQSGGHAGSGTIPRPPSSPLHRLLRETPSNQRPLPPHSDRAR